MEPKSILRQLSKRKLCDSDIERCLVLAYMRSNQICYDHSQYFKEYLADVDADLYAEVVALVSKQCDSFGIDDLVELFELLVPDDQKKEKGVAYTPREIKQFIVKETLSKTIPQTILDPACGCGAFLITAAEFLHEHTRVPLDEIIGQYIYGVDIDPIAVHRTEVLFSVLLCSYGIKNPVKFNLFCNDMLRHETVTLLVKSCPKRFDCVIGNPPYVRARNMNDETKRGLANWCTCRAGNPDLYMPFFEIGLRLLNESGRLGFISPNGYLQGINGRLLREFFVNSEYGIRVFDFRDAQLFKNVTSYTCITLVDKSTKSDSLYYKRIHDDFESTVNQMTSYSKGSFPNGKPWRMRRDDIDAVIEKLESAGRPLGSWRIRNGLATLKNDLFFFMPSGEDERFYYREYDGACYAIEKGICIDVAKPNIIKTEEELAANTEKGIFPYCIHDNLRIISEDMMRTSYPQTYAFLEKYRSLLDNRDKGNGKYPAWYAYGRTQGMNNFGKKLLIPYIAGEPFAVLSMQETLLFYCGYAVLSDNERELRMLKCFLESDAFWFYVYYTSKPYAKGYMALAKNYIVSFSIPQLDDSEIDFLLECTDKQKRNEWIWHKYSLEPQQIIPSDS